jgi:hypothetical protein
MSEHAFTGLFFSTRFEEQSQRPIRDNGPPDLLFEHLTRISAVRFSITGAPRMMAALRHSLVSRAQFVRFAAAPMRQRVLVQSSARPDKLFAVPVSEVLHVLMG